MIFDRHLQSAELIICKYHGDIPLSRFLKDFYKQNHQVGSRDRREISSLVYHFYRLGHAGKNWTSGERMLAGLFLSGNGPGELLEYFRPGWIANSSGTLEEKEVFLRSQGYKFSLEDIFPWKEELSDGIDQRRFCMSFLRQPRLFIRATPGRQNQVLDLLDTGKIAYEIFNEHIIALPNGTRVDSLIPENSWFQVQDLSSQRSLLKVDLNPFRGEPCQDVRVWDCCGRHESRWAP